MALGVHLDLLALDKLPHWVPAVSVAFRASVVKPAVLWSCPGEACPDVLSGYIPSGQCCPLCVPGVSCVPPESSRLYVWPFGSVFDILKCLRMCSPVEQLRWTNESSAHTQELVIYLEASSEQ